MGCTESRLKQGKLEVDSRSSSTQIQTVLQLDVPKKNRHASRSKVKRARTHCGSYSVQDCQDIRETNLKHRNKSQKRIFDPRITIKYNIKGIIGKGTFSRVLRVEQKITRQPYAMKIMESSSDENGYEAELSVLQRLNHPNIIKLVEAFESGTFIYMVMELATGGNLLDRLELRGPYPESEARAVLKMVLSGVSYLHSVGITHRDLKPDNILYYHPGNDSKIMISDFGLASTRQALHSGQYMNTACGTPQYIAPEIVARRPYTCAVDMWAIGVITYIVISNVFPFDGESDAKIFKLILKGHVRMTDMVWRTYSDEAKVFVLQLLQYDPAIRLTAAEAVHHQWLTSSTLTYSSSSLSGISSKSSSPDHDRSQLSTRSSNSSRSSKSINSLRSGHHRVRAQQLDSLSSDPEIADLLQSRTISS